MKILHLCLAGIVTDGWNYQDNLITKYQVKEGHDVTIITSKWIRNTEGGIEYFDHERYLNTDGVKMIRLDIKNNMSVYSKFKRFCGLKDVLENNKMDVLFIHNATFVDVSVVVRFLKQHRDVKVFVDCHTDFSNSAKNFMSRCVLHKIIWRHYIQKLEPFTSKFYGVLPARVDFLKEIYCTPPDKTELLVMGADDERVEEAVTKSLGMKIRSKYGINENEFLIVTGGKIDKYKSETLVLMKSLYSLDVGVKLIVFGSIDNSLLDEFNSLVDDSKVKYAGWVDARDSYAYFQAADLVVFPGRHSVFWEQVVGQGIPMVCKYWEGTTHIDIGGNVIFLKTNDINEMTDVLNQLTKKNSHKYNMMKISAQGLGKEKFSYKMIARKSITG